ncbi:MAG: hypothetical protein LBG68_02130, partial [Coriobacteriales bacterium]|nr:hypothetical protein [Coriobacteriales bacterium]
MSPIPAKSKPNTAATDGEQASDQAEAASKPSAKTAPTAKKPAKSKPPVPAANPDVSGKQIVFDSNEDRFSVADQAINDPDILKLLVENLAGAERRLRQFSA